MGTCSCASGYENIFLPREAEIVTAARVTELEKHFTLKMRDGAMQYAPGQILEVSVNGYGEIPIGFASSPTREGGVPNAAPALGCRSFDIVVRTVGRVSTAVNRLEQGQSLFVRGPLGKGFKVDEMKGHPVLVVAAGIGLCPTRSLIQYILDCRSEFDRFTLFYGVKTPMEQLFLDDLKRWRASADVEFLETVDRADETWKGNVGVITTLFPRTEITPDTRVVICGPPVMYKFVVAELDGIGVPHEHIYVDLERRMKCGLGKCGHCQMNDKYVCLDGPVFSLAEVEHLEELFS
jgi:sulfhydrogenase subunit gamma (sulfur reductase)